MRDALLVAFGGAIGAMLRYLVGTAFVRHGEQFPWHTFAINVAGAFMLGLLMALTASKADAAHGVRLFVGVGILGGFTTFSTLAYDTVYLLESGDFGAAAGNMLGTGVAGLAAAALGLVVGRAV